ncbi:hypothetical protein [Sporolactobacillus spathodeae]|uniref:Uncharacterized protein n=1 Tax=Sporolactobacillus spathodeae TaxID=1465502 RepID=A0ABS2QA56_9BACL|nr:hypothetical protein [Sporolactobacillus spathodeae]MBM7658618.1 hypothetical protein [Sporolactobacillus spathodeae]
MKKKPLITFIGALGEPVRQTRSGVPARVAVIHNTMGSVTEKDVEAAERRIAQSRMVVISPSAALGATIQASVIAKKHCVRVILDPAPMMGLHEKIRRILAQLPKRASSRQKSHAPAKKWRKRKLAVIK